MSSSRRRLSVTSVTSPRDQRQQSLSHELVFPRPSHSVDSLGALYDAHWAPRGGAKVTLTQPSPSVADVMCVLNYSNDVFRSGRHS